MLAVRPELVDVESADDDLRDEAIAATSDAGRDNLERFVCSIVKAVQRYRKKPAQGDARDTQFAAGMIDFQHSR